MVQLINWLVKLFGVNVQDLNLGYGLTVGQALSEQQRKLSLERSLVISDIDVIREEVRKGTISGEEALAQYRDHLIMKEVQRLMAG